MIVEDLKISDDFIVNLFVATDDDNDSFESKGFCSVEQLKDGMYKLYDVVNIMELSYGIALFITKSELVLDEFFDFGSLFILFVGLIIFLLLFCVCLWG